MPATICPRCRKSLSDSPDIAQFCMYCGTRLSTVQNHAPNDLTADIVTRSFGPSVESIADDLDDDTPTDTPPRAVGGYSLVRILGAGGQGSVYEAESSDSGQRVAVKLLSSKFAGSAVSVERFRQEGRLASQIAHPRCVFVYGADTDAGVPFIVMELMPGTTLKDMVDRRGPLPVGEAIARILDVIDGLIEAHRLGVIHRDVKPSNCFITSDDRVKVGDFGLSKSLVGSNPGKQLTTSGKFVGTVLFAPPEQIRGEEVGYDSDVYSVAATMYFLLTGKAPHQHESLTAALAKAISEPPPPMREHRSDVPKELDRAVLRGLERERGRRWQSLEEFRDALLELLPSRHTPARPRSLIAAYLLDSFLWVLAFQLPVELIREWATFDHDFNLGVVTTFDPILWIGSILYYALFEGLLGWSPGKWLLRLRVVRVGETGPPGFLPALKRTAVFHAIWFGMLVVPVNLGVWARPIGPTAMFLAVIVGVGLFVSGLVALLNQFRPKWGYRGVHDLASGCRAVQRPQRNVRRRLVSKHPNPLDRFMKPAADLPKAVGGFTVRGQIADTLENGLIWLAEDQSLSRRVLLWLRPTDGPAGPPAAVVRPTRLRQVGEGCVEWNGKMYEWSGSVAPAGAPLADVVDPKDPISWADARPILEQLTDELKTAEADGTLPARLGVDQLWVEPAGRLHLLDFALPTTTTVAGPSESPLGLVRQAAAHALSGRPWQRGNRIRAPLPPHAAAIADHLTQKDSPYQNLATLQKDLAESHIHPARVTAGVRATHVGLQGLFLIVPHLLVLLVGLAMAYTWLQAIAFATQADSAERLARETRNPAMLVQVSRIRESAEALSPAYREQTLAAVAERAKAASARADANARETLIGPERVLLRRVADAMSLQDREWPPWVVAEELAYVHRLNLAGINPAAPDQEFAQGMRGLVGSILIIGGFFMLNRVLCAILFRGGVSWLLTGVTLVRDDGTPCGRLRCGVRALVVWLPVAALCLALVGVQYEFPNGVAVRVTLSIVLVMVLIGYAAIAVRYPSRPPQDRLMGTHIVPM